MNEIIHTDLMEGAVSIESRAQPPQEALKPAGAADVSGNEYWPDTSGALRPVESIKPADKLKDETVRKMIWYAKRLSAELSRFRAHSFADIADFNELIEQDYGVSRKGGAKGNVTLVSFDGLFKVQVQMADIVSYGPELQAAKKLIDDCLMSWSEDSNAELRTVVTNAFNVDKEGEVSRTELARLRSWGIEDPRWLRAMDAIKDAEDVIGVREYVRFYERDRPDGNWRAITLDLAKA